MVPEEENDGLLDAERHQARHTIAPRAQLFPVAEKFVSVKMCIRDRLKDPSQKGRTL